MNNMMKYSIKRAQSQARLSFAERKNFRLQAKHKIFLTLALLLTAVTGAWADDGTTVTWDATKKTGTFTMPGGDVMLTPIYAAATVYGSDGQTEKSAYASLKEAFLAAQNGDIIKLDGDVTVTSATDLMTSNRATEDPVQFTIDFNGHVLDGSSVGTTFMNTEHEGDQITFIDSSTGEVGGLKGMVSGKKNSFVFAGGRYSFKGMTAAEIEDMWSTSLAANGWTLAEGKKFVDLEGAPDANGFMVGIGLADYDISFKAANANTIEAGKATVTVGGTAATLTEGKVTGVKMGQQVKMTAAQGYKFRKVEAKKTTDFTDCVSTTAWTGMDAMSPAFSTPEVTTSDGRKTRFAEVYRTDVSATGVIMQQTVNVANGTYIVELYANSCAAQGVTTDMADGATDVAYVFANDVKKFITSKIASAFSESGVYTLEVTVTDGQLTLGIGKEKVGTNWHTIQIKSLNQKASSGNE
jgi:cold shock CspA family protein/methionine-rich copper-binding protein CopC